MNTLEQSLQTKLHANVLQMNTLRQQIAILHLFNFVISVYCVSPVEGSPMTLFIFYISLQNGRT